MSVRQGHALSHTFLCCSNRAKAALHALGSLGQHAQHHEDSRHVHVNLEGQDDGFEVRSRRGESSVDVMLKCDALCLDRRPCVLCSG